MQPFPIYLLAGGAGSGKDTVAEMMIKDRNGAMIAQADPMKRFAMDVFGFTYDQLWGPSASRNAPDQRFNIAFGGMKAWNNAFDRLVYEGIGKEWLKDIGAENADAALYQWFVNLRHDCETTGKILTPRACLQLLGTEFGRAVDPNIWSNYAIKTAKKLLAGGYIYTREVGLTQHTHAGYSFVVITDGRFRNEVLNIREIGGAAVEIASPKEIKDKDGAAVESAGVKGHASEAELKGIPGHWFTHYIFNDKALGLENLRDKVNAMMTGDSL